MTQVGIIGGTNGAHGTAPTEFVNEQIIRAAELLGEQKREVFERTDRLFAGLMGAQWLAGIIIAHLVAPRAWEGHPELMHAPLAWLIGSVLSGVAIGFAVLRPGQSSTRYVIATCQMLWSSLFIHLTGGRVETHFHVFGSLALLALYRDWTVFLPATGILAADYFLRGVFFPESMFGSADVPLWRWLEHFGWIAFETTFLVYSCRKTAQEMSEVAEERAEIESVNEQVERTIVERTAQNWLRSEAARITGMCHGVHDVQTLAKLVIQELAPAVGAGAGVFYVRDFDDHGSDSDYELAMLGTYAFDSRKQIANRIRVGEGLIGQCVLEKKPILLTPVPSDYLRIQSGLGTNAPLNVLVTPILLEQTVMGAIELASFRELTTHERALLTELATTLGVLLDSLKSRLKTELLLSESQRLSEEARAQASALEQMNTELMEKKRETERMNEELGAQKEELQAANDELEEKSKALREQKAEVEHKNDQLQSQAEELSAQTEELQAANEELEEKSEALERQKAEVENKNLAIESARQAIEVKARELELASKYKSEFLANMSHELRTPLNSLLILAQSLADNDEGNLNADQIESAGIICSGGRQLLTLINDILDLSKVEAGKLTVEIKEVETNDFVRALERQFQPLAKKQGIEFRLELGGDLPARFASDRQRTEQILRNLLSNAFKFTHAGSVTLRAGATTNGTGFYSRALTERGALSFAVVDTGIGIPAEKQEAIFEAFQQADGSTSRRYGGTGLGLTISRELARLLEGEIHVKSKEGEGSTFTLYLPRHRDGVEMSVESPSRVFTAPPVAVPEQPAPTPAPPVAYEPPFLPDDRDSLRPGDRCVLVIEDDAAFAEIVLKSARRKGYKCLAANSGRSGLRLASEHQPTAVVLDIGLPDGDGLKLLQTLKNDLRTRHIPVHVVSGHDRGTESLESGAVGFLMKPATLEAIHSVFAKAESVVGARIKRLLVVEDDIGTQKAIAGLLALDNMEITNAMSGAEACRLLAGERFDCVIVDLTLGDMSGFELLEKLHRQAAAELPPVIVYTGRELSWEENRQLREYAQTIVVKGANSPERLLDEVSLFLHSVESTLPESQRRTIRHLHDQEETLRDVRVLLVDDDMRNSFALSKVLRQRGLQVVQADNGQKAIEKLEGDGAIGIVLMDIMMPVMDGYEAMRRIRQQPQWRDLPMLALTAKAMPEDRTKCFEAGANDYLSKPVDVNQLLSLMRVWLFDRHENGTRAN